MRFRVTASTETDTRPASDWLERQLARLASGSRVAGRIGLDPWGRHGSRARCCDATLAAPAGGWLESRASSGAQHHHFAGASLSVIAGTYGLVGGITPQQPLEHTRFAERLGE